MSCCSIEEIRQVIGHAGNAWLDDQRLGTETMACVSVFSLARTIGIWRGTARGGPSARQALRSDTLFGEMLENERPQPPICWVPVIALMP